MIPKFKDERGFTIQELMVVIIVGTMLVSFCLSIFLFGQKLFSSWQRKAELQRTVANAIQIISRDVLISSYATQLSDTGLTLKRNSENNVMYGCNGKFIRRNGEMIFPAGEISLKVLFAQRNKSDKCPSLLNIKVEGRSKSLFYSSQAEIAIPFSSKAQFVAQNN